MYRMPFTAVREKTGLPRDNLVDYLFCGCTKCFFLIHFLCMLLSNQRHGFSCLFLLAGSGWSLLRSSLLILIMRLWQSENSQGTWLQFCKERHSEAICPLNFYKVPYYRAPDEGKHPGMFGCSWRGEFSWKNSASLSDSGSLSVSWSQSWKLRSLFSNVWWRGSHTAFWGWKEIACHLT